MATTPRPRPRWRALLCAVTALVLLGTVASTTPAEAKRKRSARARSSARATARSRRPVSRTAVQLAQVRAQRATAAKKVKASTAERARVAAALRDINADVASQTAVVGSARSDLSEATAEAADARSREADAEAQLARLGSARRRAITRAYIAAGSGGPGLTAASLNETGQRLALQSIATREDADAIDRARELEEDLSDARAAASRAETKAAARKRAYEKRLAGYKRARADQEAYANSVEDRYERQLAEAESLAALDKNLAAQLNRESQVYAAQLRAARVSGSVGGRIPNVGSVVTGSTNGIVVAASIRGNLAAMLAAARADGVILRGGGYRSSASQIALRRAHCGSSSFAVYQMRASQCRPPTARPGASMHERGLAIDFQDQNGILTRGSVGYRWLRANAARYGFKNLPSEPWHWSVNGR